MNLKKKTCWMILFALSSICIYPQVLVKGNKDKYMATQNLVWEQLPYQWNEGAFLGNGRVGMMIYVDSIDNSLTLWLGRPDVTDHRLAPDKKTSMGVKGASVLTDFCRMDIGKMKLYPKADILDGRFVLDIYKGELHGKLNTSCGEIAFTAYTPSSYEVNVVEVETDVPCRWNLIPGSPRSPRILAFPHLKEQIPYEDNPPVLYEADENEGAAVHSLTAGGDYATYWRKVKNGKRKTTLWVATANAVPLAGVSLSQARRELGYALEVGSPKLRKETTKWWNAFFDGSIINLPDKKMENFYYIQMYKLAICSHPKGPAIDNLGVCYKPTTWPGIWWNLNVQLTYMSTHVTNKLEQGKNFQTLMDEYFLPVLEAHNPAKVGDFAWALNTYYSYMRYAGKSWNEISEKVMPKAEAILALYLPHLKEKDGHYNLLGMESPEYEGFEVYDNSNYNLANLHWILNTLYDLSKRSGISREKQEYWRTLDERLHDYPTDENGFMIASDKPVAKSHRHYSHLLSFYPLRLHNPDKPETRSLLEKSIDHWLSIGNGGGLAGYSYTGAASLYAFLGDGDKTYNRLGHFLNQPIGLGLLLPNTLYTEGLGKNPVIETPLSAATATAEMLLQSWGEVIRPFPAIPTTWKECSFMNLRAEGGFVVSAACKKGKLQWVEVRSEAGMPCRIKLKEWGQVYQSESTNVPVSRREEDVYELKLKKGESVVLSDIKEMKAEINLDNTQDSSKKNWYGVKRGKGLPQITNWPDH